MGLRLDDIEKDVVKNSKYWTLRDNDVLKGSFLNDNFERQESEYQGKPIIKYSTQFTGSLNGGEVMTKTYSMSGALIKRISDTANLCEQNFVNSIFAIKRLNKGGRTEYLIQVVGKKDNPVSGIRPDIDASNVPF